MSPHSTERYIQKLKNRRTRSEILSLGSPSFWQGSSTKQQVSCSYYHSYFFVSRKVDRNKNRIHSLLLSSSFQLFMITTSPLFHTDGFSMYQLELCYSLKLGKHKAKLGGSLSNQFTQKHAIHCRVTQSKASDTVQCKACDYCMTIITYFRHRPPCRLFL